MHACPEFTFHWFRIALIPASWIPAEQSNSVALLSTELLPEKVPAGVHCARTSRRDRGGLRLQAPATTTITSERHMLSTLLCSGQTVHLRHHHAERVGDGDGLKGRTRSSPAKFVLWTPNTPPRGSKADGLGPSARRPLVLDQRLPSALVDLWSRAQAPLRPYSPASLRSPTPNTVPSSGRCRMAAPNGAHERCCEVAPWVAV
jgi:hypothetical protein